MLAPVACRMSTHTGTTGTASMIITPCTGDLRTPVCLTRTAPYLLHGRTKMAIPNDTLDPGGIKCCCLIRRLSDSSIH